MSVSFFSDKAVIPDEARFAVALGNSYEWYDKIRNFIATKYATATPEWKYYGTKSGWVLKMLQKKKNLFFVIPCNGYFRVAFTLGEKALAGIWVSDLPDHIKEQWKEAPKHAEGRTVQFDVKDQRDYHFVTRHIEIKLCAS